MTVTQNKQASFTMPQAFRKAFFKVVPYEERPDFLSSQFDNSIHDSGLFERELFKTARHLYDGEVVLKWEMAKVKSNTADTFFMYPSTDKQYTLAYSDDNGDEQFDILDNKMFGLIITIITLDESSCRGSEEQEFATLLSNHSAALYKAIDDCMVSIDDGSNAELRKQLIAMFELIEKHTE